MNRLAAVVTRLMVENTLAGVISWLLQQWACASLWRWYVSKGYCECCGPCSQREKLLRVGPTWRKERSTLLPEFVLANKKAKELTVSLLSDELFTLLRLLSLLHIPFVDSSKCFSLGILG